MTIERELDKKELYSFMTDNGMFNISNKDHLCYYVVYNGVKCMCQVRWAFNHYELMLRPILSTDNIGNGAGGMVSFSMPPKELPIEDTTILSPNEVIECYRKSYREGYLTPSMFLERLNQLVKEKQKKLWEII